MGIGAKILTLKTLIDLKGMESKQTKKSSKMPREAIRGQQCNQ